MESESNEELWDFMYTHKLERENEELQLRLKSIQRNHEKEMRDLHIMYQSEKAMVESLQESVKQYPATLTKVKALQDELKAASSKIKMLKATIEVITSPDSQDFIIKRLESELQSHKATNLAELNEKAQAAQKLHAEFDRYKKAFEELQVENQSLCLSVLNEKEEKAEVLQLKTHLEHDLTEANEVIETLKQDMRALAEDIRMDERNKQQEQALKLKGASDDLVQQLAMKEESLQYAQHALEKTRSEKLSIASLAQELEWKVKQLQLDNEQLEAQYQMKNKAIQELEQSLTSCAEDTHTENFFNLQVVQQEKEQLFNKLQENERKHQKALGQKEEEIDLLKDQISNLLRDKEYADAEKKRFKDRVAQVLADSSQLRQEVSEAQAARTLAVKQTKELMSSALHKVTTERDQLRQQVDELQNQIDFARNSILAPGTSLFDELGNCSNRGSGIRESFRPPDYAELAKKDLRIKQLEQRTEELSAECAVHQQAIASLNAQLATNQTESTGELHTLLTQKDELLKELYEQQELLQEECANLQERLARSAASRLSQASRSPAKGSFLSVEQLKRKESLKELLDTKDIQAPLPVEVEVVGTDLQAQLEEKEKVIKEFVQEQLDLYEQINLLEEVMRETELRQQDEIEALQTEVNKLRSANQEAKSNSSSTLSQLQTRLQQQDGYEHRRREQSAQLGQQHVQALLQETAGGDRSQSSALSYPRTGSVEESKSAAPSEAVVSIVSLLTVPSKDLAVEEPAVTLETPEKASVDISQNDLDKRDSEHSHVQGDGLGADLLSPVYQFNHEALYQLAAEKELYKAEVQKLQTHLTLQTEEWALYNNQLREDLESGQRQVIALGTQVKKLQQQNEVFQAELQKALKPSRWKKFLRVFGRKSTPNQKDPKLQAD